MSGVEQHFEAQISPSLLPCMKIRSRVLNPFGANRFYIIP